MVHRRGTAVSVYGRVRGVCLLPPTLASKALPPKRMKGPCSARFHLFLHSAKLFLRHVSPIAMTAIVRGVSFAIA